MAFGGTIKLQGEKEYRQALQRITDNLKVVGTELSKVSSQFGKNEASVESLTAKNEVLTDKLNEQKKALDLTRDMLNKAKEEYDKSVTAVADLKDELNKAQTALDKAKNSTEATADEISTLEGNVKELEDKLSAAEKETGNYETTVKKWTSEVNKAETAVNNTTREIKNNKTAIDKLDSATDKAADELDDLSDSMKDASKKSDKLSGDLDELKGATKKAGDGFTVFKGVLSNLVTQGINFVSSSIKNLVGEAISASDTMYKFEQTMGFAGYDDTTIKEASKNVKEYADKTVYDLETIANTTAQLAANGIEDFTGLTEALGNLNAVAGGNADTFSSVSMALTQTAGAGKLTTENWNQLANAIPGASGKLQEALKEAGAYTGDFREAMAKGEITAEEFNEAIMKLGNEPVAVEAASSVSTFEGAIGNMQATVVSGLQEIIEEIGMENITSFLTDVTDLVGEVIKVTSKAVTWVKNNLPAVLTLVGGLLTAYTSQLIANKVATIAATAAEKGMTVAQYAAATAQGALNTVMAANPIGLVIAGITALVAGFMYLWKNSESFRQFWIDLWDNIKTAVGNFIEYFKIGLDAIISFFEPIVKAIREGFSKALDKIKSVWKGAISFFKGIGESIKNIFSAVKEKVSGFFKAAFDGVKKIWNGAITFFKSVWEGIKTVFSTVASWINDNVFKPIIAFFTPVIDFFKTAFEIIFQLAEGCWNLIKILWEVVSTWFNDNVITPVVSFFTGMWEGIKNTAASAWEGIKAIWEVVSGWFKDHIITPVATFFTGMWNAIKNAASTAWNGIKAVWNVVSSWFNTTIITPVANFFKGMWEGIKKVASTTWEGIKTIWNTVASWFNTTIITPVSDFFTGMWDGLKTGASKAWRGIKTVFTSVPTWFKNIFSEAWQKVKDVFSTGGKIFDGIKDGIVSAFKTVVNAIIKGINKVISIPFNAINDILDKIRNVSIMKYKPFENLISRFDVPQIPTLAKGTVTTGPMLAEIGEAGAEAVVPLENNTGWIRRIAEELHRNLAAVSISSPQTTQNAADALGNKTTYTYIVAAFKDALKSVKVEMDSDEMGRFVERTVADAIYT